MNTKEYRSALNKLLCDRPIAYHPILAKISGSVIAGIMLSQLLYWTGTRAAQKRGGWIYKSVEEFEEETGLSKRNQQTARKRLLENKLIEAVLKGVPRTWFYKVDFDKIADLIFHWEQSAPNDESETRPILEAVCAQLNKKQKNTNKNTTGEEKKSSASAFPFDSGEKKDQDQKKHDLKNANRIGAPQLSSLLAKWCGVFITPKHNQVNDLMALINDYGIDEVEVAAKFVYQKWCSGTRKENGQKYSAYNTDWIQWLVEYVRNGTVRWVEGSKNSVAQSSEGTYV